MKVSRDLTHKVLFGMSLILLSVFVYAIHYLIFRDAHHIFLYMVGDVAFVFVEVLLVTLIIHQILSEREKRSMLKKLNMVIGCISRSEVSIPSSRAISPRPGTNPRPSQSSYFLLVIIYSPFGSVPNSTTFFS